MFFFMYNYYHPPKFQLKYLVPNENDTITEMCIRLIQM